MLITLATILGIAVLIVAHEWGHFWAAKKFHLKVEEFGVGFPPRLFSKRKGETVYSFNVLPLGGFVKIAGEGENEEDLKHLSAEEKKRLFTFQKPWKRAVVIGAGIAMNFLLGWLILTTVFLIGTPQGIAIGDVEKGSPAEIAGLKQGEVIMGFGETVTTAETAIENGESLAHDFSQFVDQHKGREIQLFVETDGKKVLIPVTLRTMPEPNQGTLGIRFTAIGIPRQGFFEAIRRSFEQAVVIVVLTVQGLANLLRDIFFKASIPEDVVGPVGIFRFAQETGKINLIYLLHLMSVISLNLAVLNAIPFPALDGGHLLFIFIEKLKGSAIRTKTKLVINTTGISLLILLMLVLTVREVQNLAF
ncbi:MAG: M50 family metallopeptidase [Patescibacteria group bacterium]